MMNCSKCGKELDTSYHAPSQKACPQCGSILRTVHGSVEDTVKAEDFIKVGWRDQKSSQKALRWGVGGDDLYQNSGRWSVFTRVYDRAKDWYYEHFTDKETGQVLHHCEEKLSDHDHGRRKKKKT